MEQSTEGTATLIFFADEYLTPKTIPYSPGQTVSGAGLRQCSQRMRSKVLAVFGL